MQESFLLDEVLFAFEFVKKGRVVVLGGTQFHRLCLLILYYYILIAHINYLLWILWTTKALLSFYLRNWSSGISTSCVVEITLRIACSPSLKYPPSRTSGATINTSKDPQNSPSAPTSTFLNTTSSPSGKISTIKTVVLSSYAFRNLSAIVCGRTFS